MTGSQGDRVARRRPQLARSVFLSQLVLAGAVLIVVMAHQIVEPTSPDPRFFLGVTAVFVLTAVSVAVPWERLPKPWVALVPLLDIVAIAVMRVGAPDLQSSLLNIFPIIWMSSYFGIIGATASVLLAVTTLVIGTPLEWAQIDLGDVPRLVTIPITLVFVATVTHVTSRRAAAQRSLLRSQAALLETALARAQRQQRILDEVLNAVDFGVIGFDRDGNTTIMNQAHARLHAGGSSRAGTAGEEVLYQADRITPFPEQARPFRRAVRGEEFDSVVVWTVSPGGGRRALALSARQLETGYGESDGGVLVSRDVTAEVNAIRARDDLVASVSHELRTPLTSILGYLELAMEDDALADGTRGMLDIAYRNAERLLTLIADILAASADGDSSLVLTFARCDLTEIIHQSLLSLEPKAQERTIDLIVDTDVEIEIVADGFRLRQVIDNLISNAIKYNHDGGEVHVGLAADEENAWLVVRDNGLGIADADQPRLFDRFFRAESVRRSAIHGSGLGLSISRDIIRQHGGDLTLYSVEGEGTTVIATIPKAGPAQDAAEGEATIPSLEGGRD